MKYLTVKDILLLHDLAVEQSGGSHGLRDLGLLESAIARPQATFEETDLYPSLFDKVAALCHSLVKNHAFIDGNKRAAMLSAMTMLELNGYRFECEQEELVEFAVNIDVQNLKEKKIAEWFKEHSKKVR